MPQVNEDWIPVWLLEACPGYHVNGGNIKQLLHSKAVLFFELGLTFDNLDQSVG